MESECDVISPVSKLKDFPKSQKVTYTVNVAGYQKWCKI